MDLSVVILHHGSPAEVSANLRALLRSEGFFSMEVLVVNNGTRGANRLIEVPAGLNVHFFEIENRGYAQGNNWALARARGDFLCILNPDVEVESDTLSGLLAYLKAHPHVGLVAPRLCYSDAKIQDNYRVFPRLLDLIVKRTFLRRLFLNRMRRYLMWDKNPFKSEAVDWLTGAFHVFSRSVWQQFGPQDERYFLFMSDVDFCRLIWRGGKEVHFVGEVQALHAASRLSGGGVLDLFKKWTLRVHLCDAARYYWKWFLK